VALFYLLTLYCVVRSAGAGKAAGWYVAAVLSCLLGMATKEVMVTAPIVVLLYDRTFLAGSFGEAWRRRWGVYAGLAATWGLLAYLILSTGLIGRATEMGAPDRWSYAWSQPGVILHYLRLSVWPHPLCLDYGWPAARTLGEVLPGLIAVGFLLLATVWGLVRRSPLGFLGAWFFLVLAPSSSIMPLKQMAFEHRMYLPLAAVVAAVVLSGSATCWTWGRRQPHRHRWLEISGGLLVATTCAVLGLLTYGRNIDYQEAVSIWAHTVAHAPNNAEAHNNLGVVLAGLGRGDEAIAHYRKALAIKPAYADAHNNLGVALAGRGPVEEAIAHYQEALESKPDFADAHNNLGIALMSNGQVDDAITHYQKALEIKPDFELAHNNLGIALVSHGQVDDAIAHYQQALGIKPDFAEAHNNLATALGQLGRHSEAITHCEKALKIKPDYAEAHFNLGSSLVQKGEVDEAIHHYKKGLEGRPGDATAHNNLGSALVGRGQVDEAIAHYQKALASKPDYAKARQNLAIVLELQGKPREAIVQWREAVRLQPGNIAILNRVACLLATHPDASLRNGAEAVALAQRAVQLLDGVDPTSLDTLAAAYAEAGRFPEAVQTAQRALALATQPNQQSLAESIKAKMQLYKAGTPFRETPSSPGTTPSPP
jgi:protein O-mannosyl-transferase